MKARILGIDPGLQTTGFGVVEVDGREMAYVASGTIRTREAAQSDLPGRLKIIFDGVREVIQTYAPDCASVEIVFVNVNPQSTLLLGLVAGACGTLGDFVMRALKKDAGVHWWGNKSSVTGAVGLLDRVAPLCFAAPVFFHSVRWYFSRQ